MILTKKDLPNNKILFYGPAPTKDKQDLDVNSFDAIIITNNMVSLFFEKYEKINGKVILIANSYFCRNRHHKIKEKSENLYGVWVKGFDSYNKVSGFKETSIIRSDLGYENSPLCLALALSHLKYLSLLGSLNPFYFYIAGATFYSEPYKIYDNDYKIIKNDSRSHDIQANIKYLKKCMGEKWIDIDMCEELKAVIEQK